MRCGIVHMQRRHKRNKDNKNYIQSQFDINRFYSFVKLGHGQNNGPYFAYTLAETGPWVLHCAQIWLFINLSGWFDMKMTALAQVGDQTSVAWQKLGCL